MDVRHVVCYPGRVFNKDSPTRTVFNGYISSELLQNPTKTSQTALRTNTAVLIRWGFQRYSRINLVFPAAVQLLSFRRGPHTPAGLERARTLFLARVRPRGNRWKSWRTLLVGRDCFNLNSEIIWLLKVTLGRRWRKHSANWGLFSDGRLRSPGRGEASRN